MFNCRGNLFLKNDGYPVKFVVLDSSSDKDTVSRLIKSGGGWFSVNATPVTNVINLSCKCLPWMTNFELFSTSYVYACCRRNKKLSLAGFRYLRNFIAEVTCQYPFSAYISCFCIQCRFKACSKQQHILEVNVNHDSLLCKLLLMRKLACVFSIGKKLSKENLNELTKRYLFLPSMCHSYTSQSQCLLEEYYDEKDSRLYEDSYAICKKILAHSASMEEPTNGKQLVTDQNNFEKPIWEEKTVISEIFPNDSASMKREFIDTASQSKYSLSTSCGSLGRVEEQEWYTTISNWLRR